MAGKKAIGAQPTFRWQRFHPALVTGEFLTAHATREAPMRVHFRQSELDGACGPHCVAAALVILGLAKSHALTLASSRKYGAPAAFWKAFSDVWFTGCGALDLIDRLESMPLPLSVEARLDDADDVVSFAAQQLSRGELVMLAFDSVFSHKTKHWALGVGSEGMQTGKTATVDTLLLICPAAEEPDYRCFNARLRQFTAAERRQWAPRIHHSHRSNCWCYESPTLGNEVVRLTAAVRIRRA